MVRAQFNCVTAGLLATYRLPRCNRERWSPHDAAILPFAGPGVVVVVDDGESGSADAEPTGPAATVRTVIAAANRKWYCAHAQRADAKLVNPATAGEYDDPVPGNPHPSAAGNASLVQSVCPLQSQQRAGAQLVQLTPAGSADPRGQALSFAARRNLVGAGKQPRSCHRAV